MLSPTRGQILLHGQDVLKELLDPSARINEKFQSYAFELENGQQWKVLKGSMTLRKPFETPDIERQIEQHFIRCQGRRDWFGLLWRRRF